MRENSYFVINEWRIVTKALKLFITLNPVVIK